MDPPSWDLGRRRPLEYVVKEACTRRIVVLDRKTAGDWHAAEPMRRPIQADSRRSEQPSPCHRGPKTYCAMIDLICSHNHLDRGQRVTAWRLLHGGSTVPSCGASIARMPQDTDARIQVVSIRLPLSPMSQ